MKILIFIIMTLLIIGCSNIHENENKLARTEISNYFDQQKELIFQDYNLEMVSKTGSYSTVTHIYIVDKNKFDYEKIKSNLNNNKWIYRGAINDTDIFCDNNQNLISITAPANSESDIKKGYITIQSVDTWNIGFAYTQNGEDKCK